MPHGSKPCLGNLWTSLHLYCAFSLFLLLESRLSFCPSLCQLIVECGVGIAVFVRCFVDRKGMNHQIAEKLGVGFSQIPFAIVVVGLLPRLLCIISFVICLYL